MTELKNDKLDVAEPTADAEMGCSAQHGVEALEVGVEALSPVLRELLRAPQDVRDEAAEQLVRALRVLEQPDDDWPGLAEHVAKDWLRDLLSKASSPPTPDVLDALWLVPPGRERAVRAWGLDISPGDKALGALATSCASAIVKEAWRVEAERRRAEELRAALPLESVLYDTSTGEYVVRGPSAGWCRRAKKDGMLLVLGENGYDDDLRKDFLRSVGTVDGITKAYGRPTGRVIVEGIPKLNVWKHGPASPKPGEYPNIDKLLLNLCGSLTAAIWMKRWLATWLQAALIQGNPVKTGLAPVYYGVPGGGKNTLAEIIVSIIGHDEVLLLNQGVLDSQFDPPVEGKLFVFANEVVSSTNRTKETANRLKEMVTETVLSSQLKHKDAKNIRAPFNMMFASNDPRALFIEPDDRRFVVLRSKAKLDPVVAAALYADMGDRGIYDGPLLEVGGLLHDLLSRTDLLAPGEILETPEKTRMIAETGMSNMDDFIHELEDVGAYAIGEQYRDSLRRRGRSDVAETLTFVWDDEDPKGVSPDDLYLAYSAWCKDRGTNPSKRTTFDGTLAAHGYKKAKRKAGMRLWVWEVPLGTRPDHGGAIEAA